MQLPIAMQIFVAHGDNNLLFFHKQMHNIRKTYAKIKSFKSKLLWKFFDSYCFFVHKFFIVVQWGRTKKNCNEPIAISVYTSIYRTLMHKKL